MGRYLVPLTIVAAMFAFTVASLLAAFSPYQPTWWSAAVQLAVLGAVTPMIYAVNIRVVPVFSRRQWSSIGWLRAQIALALAGAWLEAAGLLVSWDWLVTAGATFALAGGILFMVNVVRLFRQPAPPSPRVTMPMAGTPPAPAGQDVVDKLATHFTRLSGLFLLFGLGLGWLLTFWEPESGRWELVWAHTMLVGFMLSMASGVSYHVLPRWTGLSWASPNLIRLHLLATVVALPAMLVALAAEVDWLFTVAGPLQALALALYLANVAPLLAPLPGTTRWPVSGAVAFLLVGITLGAAFAIDPALGARLRQSHAEVNLFGWTGLLITGFGYYLVPRFIGHPLRWPRLAQVQIAALIVGVASGAVAFAYRAYEDLPREVVVGANLLIALGFGLLTVIFAGTALQLRRRQAATVSAVPLMTPARPPQKRFG